MGTLAHSAYLDSEFGQLRELPRAGSALENPYVFDATARELKGMAERGLVEIVSERTVSSATGPLIDRLCFRRVR
jgi:hypothetical protein